MKRSLFVLCSFSILKKISVFLPIFYLLAAALPAPGEQIPPIWFKITNFLGDNAQIRTEISYFTPQLELSGNDSPDSYFTFFQFDITNTDNRGSFSNKKIDIKKTSISSQNEKNNARRIVYEQRATLIEQCGTDELSHHSRGQESRFKNSFNLPRFSKCLGAYKPHLSGAVLKNIEFNTGVKTNQKIITALRLI